MCVQLDLFSGVSLQEPFEVLTESEYQEMVQRADIADAVVSFDPCPNCRYRDMCDPDGCGMHSFSYYSKNPLKGRSWKYGY